MFKTGLVILLLMFGCATSSKINRISLGDSKETIIDKMGDPVSTKADSGVEVLEYRLSDTPADALGRRYSTYWVMLKDGKTVKYGRAGDFDTSIPKQEIHISQ